MTITEKGWNADDLEQNYYKWLTGSVIPGWNSYSVLLRNLYETPFRVTLLMDENRVGDGLSMRARFVYTMNLSANDRDILKRMRPCSVLEVMIGLAQRFEEEYINDDNPIGTWVWPMITSLGLQFYDNEHFDLYGYDRIMKDFLDRAYSPDGRGSLFYIPGATQDLRQIEIWQQMMMWNQRRTQT